MKVLAPGKLILSGEHSVVYDKPALAMAVNRYVTASAISQHSPFISFNLSDLAYEHRFRFTTLRQLKDRIKRKYERFMQGEFKIREVLQKPVELAQFAFMLFLEALNIKLSQGIKIHVESDIPIGCGMGSSAATILSIVYAIAHHVGVDLPAEVFYRLGLEAENMQHGYSSGLDLRVSLQGGCLYLKEGLILSRPVPSMTFYLVNTGTPQTTTGECVAAVASQFKTSSIWKEFEFVTDKMDQALQANQSQAVKEMVSENHQLLVNIGVVPAQVKNFITEIEQVGGAAKICGAGAISGEQAGVMLVLADDEAHLKKTCEKYHYSLLPVSGEVRGVHVV